MQEDKDAVHLTFVITHGGKKKISFMFHLGTRQEHPISPSPLTIFSQPRAAAIHQSVHIKRIQTLNTCHEVALYAEDILPFLKNLHSSSWETIKPPEVHSNISDYSTTCHKFSSLHYLTTFVLWLKSKHSRWRHQLFPIQTIWQSSVEQTLWE